MQLLAVAREIETDRAAPCTAWRGDNSAEMQGRRGQPKVLRPQGTNDVRLREVGGELNSQKATREGERRMQHREGWERAKGVSHGVKLRGVGTPTGIEGLGPLQPIHRWGDGVWGLWFWRRDHSSEQYSV